jgi:hypothetical protein
MDKKHTPLALAVGDKAYLRLHHGYSLPSTVKAKISQQRVGPFEVIHVVGKNAYTLALPSSWKVWPVISAVFLEPAMKNPDPFERTLPPPPPVIQEGDTPDHVSYEVSAVVKKRYNKRRKCIEYLLRWKGYGAEHDQWFPEIELEHCQDLVKDYEMATGNTQWKSRFFSDAEPPVTSPVPEESPLRLTAPTLVDEPVEPTLDLSRSETPPAAQGNLLDAPAKGPVTLLRRSTRLERKA